MINFCYNLFVSDETFILFRNLVSRGSSISIVTRLLAGQTNFESPQGLGFPSSPPVQIGSGAHPSSYTRDTGGSFPKGKAAGA